MGGPGTVLRRSAARRPALWRAALLGAATGGRSTSGPAVLALIVPAGERHRPASWLASSRSTAVVLLAAAGEFGLDKYPGAPSRLAPAGFVPRVLLGGLAGAAVCAHVEQTEEPRRWAAPAAVAATAAVAGALAGARWRALVHRSPVPDWLGALAEDAVVLALAAAACARPHADDDRDRVPQ